MKVEDKFSKAYKEVMEILKYMPEKSVKKIPKSLLETFETNMDKNHNFTVDVNKSFEEQELLEETKDIFANIFRDYWASEYQKEKIIAKQNYDRQVLEEEKRLKYNPNDLFKSKVNIKEQIEKQNIEKNDNLPVEYKESFFKRFIDFIKNIFVKKKKEQRKE